VNHSGKAEREQLLAPTTVTAGGLPRTVVTVTLGSTASSNGSLHTSSSAAAMVWSPTSSVTSGAGVASSTAPATETGTWTGTSDGSGGSTCLGG